MHKKCGSLIVSLILLININTFTQLLKDPLEGNQKAEQVRDADQNIYRTVRLGGQIWLAENLKTTKYNDGTPVPLVTDPGKWSALTTPGYCWYNNDEKTGRDKFGALYNWYAIQSGNLCPAGWHVPEDAEWLELEKYLIAGGFDYEGNPSGNKIAKSLASAEGWIPSENKGAVGNADYPLKRNATGFTALPGGYRYGDGSFNGLGSHGDWWFATEYGPDNAWGRNLLYFYDSVHRGLSSKKNGFSVRCLKD